MKNILMVLLLATGLSAAAQDQPPSDFYQMCYGEYALCIKAPCTKQADANNLYPCGCVVKTGWNMGPNSCKERVQSLTSTYSNELNDGSATVSCAAPTDWAWCYGAKCEKDPKDPTKAICKCPMITSATVILVSQSMCDDQSTVCRMLWSGALPAESKFANNHYYTWMTNHGLDSDPPAQACPPPSYEKK